MPTIILPRAGLEPVPRSTPARRVLTACTVVLNDKVMGLLAILALGTAVMPELFALSPAVEKVLDRIEWSVVALFVADYLVHLGLAADKKAYVYSGWRLLDLGIILAASITLVPAVSNWLRLSLLLRLLRVFRAVSFGIRASAGFVVWKEPVRAAALPSAPRCWAMGQQPPWQPQFLTWAELLRRTADPAAEWLDVVELGTDHCRELAAALGLSVGQFGALLGSHSHPYAKVLGGRLVVSVWLPVRSADAAEVDRVHVLLTSAVGRPLLTVALRDCQLQTRMARWEEAATFALAGTLTFFRLVLEQIEETITFLESSLRVLEDFPIARSGTEFFRQAFRMRRDLAQVKADLWRVNGILDFFEAGRLVVPGCTAEASAAFTALSDQADYLYETASNLQEGLNSLIELHLNTVSFQMNRFMWLLAMASVLGLVPATVGGLLGMNIEGNPWPVTLDQVVFGVVLVMLAITYLFFISSQND